MHSEEARPLLDRLCTSPRERATTAPRCRASHTRTFEPSTAAARHLSRPLEAQIPETLTTLLERLHSSPPLSTVACAAAVEPTTKSPPVNR